MESLEVIFDAHERVFRYSKIRFIIIYQPNKENMHTLYIVERRRIFLLITDYIIIGVSNIIKEEEKSDDTAMPNIYIMY